MFQSEFNQTGLTPQALAAWAAFEEAAGRGFGINSGYRDPEHNERVGGARNSQHTHGNAFDVDVSDLPIAERQRLIGIARESGFGGVGVYDNALHFDVGNTRHWGPDFSASSTPEWALGALGAERAAIPHDDHETHSVGPAGGPIPGTPSPTVPDGLFAGMMARLGEEQAPSSLYDTLSTGRAFEAPEINLPPPPQVQIAASNRDTLSPYLQLFQQIRG